MQATRTESKGRSSAQAPATEALAADWARAADLNRDRLNDTAWEWVPTAAIVLREDILPRKRDEETVEAYRLVRENLPPITVQRDTFVLIDGLHRLAAHYGGGGLAGSDLIRIVEVDAADADLWIEAFRANREHGLQLKQGERVAFARKLLREKADWSDGAIAEAAGVHRNTVWQWRQDSKRRAEEAQVAQNVQPDRRVGRDGKSYPVAQHEQLADNGQQGEFPYTNPPSYYERPTGAVPKPRGKRDRRQMAFDWLDALDHAFDDAPDPAFIDPEWAGRAAAQLRDVERRLRRTADEAATRAQAFEARAADVAESDTDPDAEPF